MIRWVGAYQTFYEYALDARGDTIGFPDHVSVRKVAYNFAGRFNCDTHFLGSYLEFSCSEEDFTIIMLTCPEAVKEITT
jgi:hypothetical protein